MPETVPTFLKMQACEDNLNNPLVIGWVDNQTVDFLFLDPGLFAKLRYSHDIRAIGTIRRHNQGTVEAKLGGVIFRKSDQHSDIINLTQLAGFNLTLCAVHDSSFAGWIVQQYALYELGLDVWEVFTQVNLTRDHHETFVLELHDHEDQDKTATVDQNAGFLRPLSYDEEALVLLHLNLMDPEKGRYADEVGAVECKICPQGKSTFFHGQTECEDAEELAIYEPIEACRAFPNKTLRVGVQTEEEEAAEEQWKPTFEGLLNSYFNRYDCFFKMVALHGHELEEAVEAREVDFLFTDGGLYSQLNNLAGAKAVATVIQAYNGFVSHLYGGVIVRHANRNLDLDTLQDIANTNTSATRNLTACAVDDDSFEGWQVQWFEFFKAGIVVNQIFASIPFTHSDEECAALVESGEADVGFLDTSKLEKMAYEEEQLIETWHIINRRFHPGFRHMASTDLYPQWALSVLPHVAEEITSEIQIPLKATQPFDEAAVVGLYAGFTSPRDYSSSANVLYQLNLMEPEVGLCQPGSTRNWTAWLRPCQKCSPGRYEPHGHEDVKFPKQLCIACVPGKYNDEVGEVDCKDCPKGKLTYLFGQTECEEADEIVVYDPIEACREFANKTLTVVVQAEEEEAAEEQWKPTFEGLLNSYFNRYDCFFKMVALDGHELEHAVKDQEVDFLFTSGGFYSQLKFAHHASRVEAVASVIRSANGFVSHLHGGVIFRLSTQNLDLNTLQDVASASAGRSLTACALHDDSFEGWQVQWFEFFKAGIDVNQIFASITFTHSDEDCAGMVESGEAGTCILEKTHPQLL
eukprot:g66293.t1